MKRLFSILVIVLFMGMFLLPSNAFSISFTKLGQAQDLIKEVKNLRAKITNLEKIGEDSNAMIFRQNVNQKLHDSVTLLAHVLGDDPNNKVALFTLGVVYFYQGDPAKARDKFFQCSMDEEIKTDIYGFYIEQSNESSLAGNIRESLELVREASYFVPNDKNIQNEMKEMGQGFFKKAIYDMDHNEYQGAQENFLTAVACDKSLAEPSAKEMLKAASKISNYTGQAKLLMCAYELDNSLSDNVVDAAILLGKTAKKQGDKNTQESLKAIFQGLGPEKYANFHAAVWPPKKWKTVYRKTFVGVGNTGGDNPKYNDGGLATAVFGKDLEKGHKYTVVDSDFEVWRSGGWKKCRKGVWLTVAAGKPGKKLYIRNKKGIKFSLVVQKYF